MGKPDVSQKRNCWICFNNENNILTTVKSQKMLKNFSAYLQTPFFTIPTEVTPVFTCCIYCYESVLQLTLLQGQIEKLQKEISGLSSLFTANIMDRRNRFANGKNKDFDTSTDSTPTTEKYLTIKNNSDQLSTLVIENVIGMKEVAGNVSKELPSDIQPEMEIENIFTNLVSDSDEQEFVAKVNSGIDINSDDDIDVKYSYDQIISKEDCPVSKSIVPIRSVLQTDPHDDQQANATSLVDLLKLGSMPIVQIKSLQQCGKSDSPKIVDVAFEDTIKYGKDIYHSTKEINNFETKSQGSTKRQITFNKGIKTISNTKELCHPGENPHTCSVCNEAFQSSGLLKRHLKFHSKKNPSKCSFCSKTFYQSIHLKIHERFHTGERPFKCSYCPKTFFIPSHAKRHEMIHSRKTL